MKKAWVAAVVAVVVVGALVYLAQRKPVKNGIATAPNAHLAMTATEISAAINYGKNHKDDLLIDFENPWTVFLGWGSSKGRSRGNATIFTQYHCLALIARNSVKNNSDMDTKNLCRLCAENYKGLYFKVTLYGDEYGFDRDYKAVVLKDGREIPILKTFHQGYDQGRDYMVSSQQKLYLPVNILSEKGKITLQILKPEEPLTKTNFVFDLKKIP